MRNYGRNNNTQLISGINITPFVDVMLVLLIIFMVTSPMLISGVNVDLPETTDTPIVGDDEPLAITINKKSEIFIKDLKVLPKDLISKLKVVTKEKKNTRIFVRGDKTVDYGTIMQVVGQINAAGFNKVALVTQISNK